MMRFWVRVGLGIALAACGSLAHAQAPSGTQLRQDSATREADERIIAEGERAWGQAYVTGDLATVRHLLADDFLGVDPRGRIYNKAAVLSDVREEPHSLLDEVGPVTVRFYGDTAIAQAHERQVGPAPERDPTRTVFTDTWVKLGGQWRIVAAEDLDPGAPTLPAYDEDRGAIMALRAESNRAIAAHDLAKFTPIFADDAVFVWSNGTSAIGKAGLAEFIARDFADPAFVTYIRTPVTVAVSEQGVRAVEHGTWTAIKREPRGETRYGGDYAAHWFKTAQGWRVRGELYVKLSCTGPLCTP